MSVFVPVPNPVAELITTPTVAALLGLTIPYTQQLLRTGALPGHREPGRGWVTTRPTVAEYLAAQRRANGLASRPGAAAA